MIIEKTDSKLIAELCKTRIQKVVCVHQDIFESEGDNSFLFFLIDSLPEADQQTDLLTLRLLQALLLKIKPAGQSLGKTGLTVSTFSYKVIYFLASHKPLSAEAQHELLVTCLMIFSSFLPPAPFDSELEMYLALY